MDRASAALLQRRQRRRLCLRLQHGQFRRRAAERQAEDLADAQAVALDLNDLPVNVASLREALVKLAAKTASSWPKGTLIMMRPLPRSTNFPT